MHEKSEKKEDKEKKVFGEDDNCCGNCAFFDEFDVQRRNDNVIGACKANPPYLPHDYGDNKLGQWPTVLGHFWCGIFQKVEKKGEGG